MVAKYRNKKIKSNGLAFDSKKEFNSIAVHSCIDHNTVRCWQFQISECTAMELNHA